MSSGPFSKSFGQYFNYQAIKTFSISLLTNRQNFLPHLRARSVYQVDFRKLHVQGIHHVIFDKDNTLTVPYSRHYHSEQIEQAVREAKEVFGECHVVVISNSVGSKDDKGYAEAKEVEDTLGVAVIRHVHKKPNVLKEVLDHFKCIEEDRVAVVGDRILADVVMGNSFGFFTIYVDPLDISQENFAVRLSRKFEDSFLPVICPRKKQEHTLVKDTKELLRF